MYTLAFVTTKGQFYTTLDLDVPYVAASNYRLRAYATFERNISSNYYGTGQSTLDPLHFSGAPGQSYPWAPRYDDALRARQPDGSTYTRYNNYVLARPAAHLSLERDLFGGVVRPILGVTIAHTYVRDYTGSGVDAIDGVGNTVTATQASTLLHEDCAAGRILGCDGGWDNLLKIGIAYDTRDFEPDPNSGVFADLTTEFSLRAFGSTFILAGAAMKTNDFAGARPDLFGADLQAFMKRAAKGITRITFFGEGLPIAENRLELATDTDGFGMPMGRLIHSFGDDAVALWNANFEYGMKIAKATGAKEAWPGKGPVIPTSHLLGGTIMGTGPDNSVVDSYGQTHEIPNLWMAGPGIFPSEGAPNPTFTIFALSQRGAERLASTWGTVAG